VWRRQATPNAALSEQARDGTLIRKASDIHPVPDVGQPNADRFPILTAVEAPEGVQLSG
jgi:hypothetical protein